MSQGPDFTTEISQAGFCLVTDFSEQRVTMQLSGSCDMDALPAFESFIGKLHAYLPTVPDQQVVVDVKNLYYMNSATIKCLVTWIMKVRDLNENGRYFVAFATNTQFAWQKRSLAAVQRLAPDIVTLT